MQGGRGDSGSGEGTLWTLWTLYSPIECHELLIWLIRGAHRSNLTLIPPCKQWLIQPAGISPSSGEGWG